MTPVETASQSARSGVHTMLPCGVALVVMLIGLVPTIVRAQTAPAAGEQAVIRLAVAPAATTRPALAHPLLPTALDQAPGNAAALYYLASGFIKDNEPDDRFLAAREAGGRKLLDYLATAGHHNAMASAAKAARREYCHWDLNLKTEGFRVLLPHLGPLRTIATLNAARSSARAANGDHNAALHDLQTNFAIAQHFNQQAVLLQGLVGAAVVNETAEAMHAFIQSSGSPNLYWSLAQLPRPFIDVTRMLEFERFALQFSFPPMRDPDSITREEFQRFLGDLFDIYEDPSSPAEMAVLMLRSYPHAKERMVARGGRTREQVDAMPVHVVMAHYLIDTHVEWCDEVGKWYPLPYWQARQAMIDAEKRLAASRDVADPGVRFVTAFLPALHRSRLRFAMADRRIASLQCVEALRNYAATHEGRLPASLADLTETPVPLDPVTGQPFAYRLDGAAATLDCPAPQGEPKEMGWRYEITVKR